MKNVAMERPMRTVIKNKLYDTATAKAIGRYFIPNSSITETLYRKKTGEYFLHKAEDGQRDRATPLSYEDAKVWGKMSLNDLDYNKAFLGTVQSNVVKVTLSADARGLLEAEQSRTGKTYNQILSSLIEQNL